MRSRRIAVSVLVGAVMVACGPVVTITGGELSGKATPVRGSWELTNAVDTI